MKLKTVSEAVEALVLEAMDPNYKKWRKANVTYRGTREDNPWPLDGINEYEGKFGYGLYTTPLSNKKMTKEYGKTWLIVGAIPDNPMKFNSINAAEIFFQGYAIKNGKGKDDIDKLRNFWKNTSIDKELTKLGYDGVEIKGREMVLFNPDKNKLKAFETERQLEKWYDDFFAPSTEKIEWEKSGDIYIPKRKSLNESLNFKLIEFYEDKDSKNTTYFYPTSDEIQFNKDTFIVIVNKKFDGEEHRQAHIQIQADL